MDIDNYRDGVLKLILRGVYLAHRITKLTESHTLPFEGLDSSCRRTSFPAISNPSLDALGETAILERSFERASTASRS